MARRDSVLEDENRLLKERVDMIEERLKIIEKEIIQLQHGKFLG